MKITWGLFFIGFAFGGGLGLFLHILWRVKQTSKESKTTVRDILAKQEVKREGIKQWVENENKKTDNLSNSSLADSANALLRRRRGGK